MCFLQFQSGIPHRLRFNIYLTTPSWSLNSRLLLSNRRSLFLQIQANSFSSISINMLFDTFIWGKHIPLSKWLNNIEGIVINTLINGIWNESRYTSKLLSANINIPFKIGWVGIYWTLGILLVSNHLSRIICCTLIKCKGCLAHQCMSHILKMLKWTKCLLISVEHAIAAASSTSAFTWVSTNHLWLHVLHILVMQFIIL